MCLKASTGKGMNNQSGRQFHSHSESEQIPERPKKGPKNFQTLSEAQGTRFLLGSYPDAKRHSTAYNMALKYKQQRLSSKLFKSSEKSLLCWTDQGRDNPSPSWGIFPRDVQEQFCLEGIFALSAGFKSLYLGCLGSLVS